MGWDGTGINCYGMGWDRKICPMDKPVKHSLIAVFTEKQICIISKHYGFTFSYMN